MNNRINELICKITEQSRRFRQMEEMTGIPATSWQKVFTAKQRPTMEMIEKLCSTYPECSMWITTGKRDAANNQYCIDEYLALKKHPLVEILQSPGETCNKDEITVLQICKNKIERLREESRLIDLYNVIDSKLHAEENTEIKNSPIAWFLRRGNVTKSNVPYLIHTRSQSNDFEWGYHGAKPRDLAANILYFFGLPEEVARSLATDFSMDVMSGLRHEEDWITKEEFDQWMSRKGSDILKNINNNQKD